MDGNVAFWPYQNKKLSAVNKLNGSTTVASTIMSVLCLLILIWLTLTAACFQGIDQAIITRNNDLKRVPIPTRPPGPGKVQQAPVTRLLAPEPGSVRRRNNWFRL